jgi:hypothetical protein
MSDLIYQRAMEPVPVRFVTYVNRNWTGNHIDPVEDHFACPLDHGWLTKVKIGWGSYY